MSLKSSPSAFLYPLLLLPYSLLALPLLLLGIFEYFGRQSVPFQKLAFVKLEHHLRDEMRDLASFGVEDDPAISTLHGTLPPISSPEENTFEDTDTIARMDEEIFYCKKLVDLVRDERRQEVKDLVEHPYLAPPMPPAPLPSVPSRRVATQYLASIQQGFQLKDHIRNLKDRRQALLLAHSPHL